MNMRGSGDGEALCPLLYNAGLDTDLLAALVGPVASSCRALARRRLLARGEPRAADARPPARARCRRRSRPSPPSAPPLDLAACADALEARGQRPLPALLHADAGRGLPAPARARGPTSSPRAASAGLRTVREYDDRITAPFGGYESAAQYYERSSAGPWLASIDRPALVLAAADDPMIPRAVGRALAALAGGAPRDRADRRPRRLRRRARRRPAGSGPRSGRSTSWKATRSMRRRAEPVDGLEQWWQDLRQAGRGLWRSRAFSAAAVLTLALGIAGTTVMFTLVEGVLLRPLPVRDERSLLGRLEGEPGGRRRHWPFDARRLDALTGRAVRSRRSPARAITAAGSGVVFENGSASYLRGAAVTGAFFEVLGVGPELGRALAPADDRTGAANVLVITHALWQRRYGGSHDVLGRRLQVGDRVVHDRGRHATGHRVPARRRGLDDARGQCLDRDEPGLPRGPVARRRSRRPPAAGCDARAGKERTRGLGDAARGRGFRGIPPRHAAGGAPVRGRGRGRRALRDAGAVRRRGAGAADRERERRQPAAAARGDETPRARDARDARRRSRPAGAPAVRREPAALAPGRPPRIRRQRLPAAGRGGARARRLAATRVGARRSAGGARSRSASCSWPRHSRGSHRSRS